MNIRIFTGSRKISPSLEELDKALKGADLVLVGCCPTGTDPAVVRRARQLEVDVWIFAAKWSSTKPSGRAGPDRNVRMAQAAASFQKDGHDVRCFAYPKDSSPGTRGCARELRKRGLKVKTVEL